MKYYEVSCKYVTEDESGKTKKTTIKVLVKSNDYKNVETIVKKDYDIYSEFTIVSIRESRIIKVIES